MWELPKDMPSLFRRNGKRRIIAFLQYLFVLHAARIRQCDPRYSDTKLNVVLCLDRAGLVGEDGPTHHGAFDLAYMRPIPNLTVASPYNEHELRCLMYTAQLPDKGPFVIRYPRGRGSLVDWKCPMQEIEIGKGRKLKEGKDIAVITLGPIGIQAEKRSHTPNRKQEKYRTL